MSRACYSQQSQRLLKEKWNTMRGWLYNLLYGYFVSLLLSCYIRCTWTRRNHVRAPVKAKVWYPSLSVFFLCFGAGVSNLWRFPPLSNVASHKSSNRKMNNFQLNLNSSGQEAAKKDWEFNWFNNGFAKMSFLTIPSPFTYFTKINIPEGRGSNLFVIHWLFCHNFYQFHNQP